MTNTSITVPDVVGTPQADATTVITTAGLILGAVTTASSSTHDVEGNVLHQDAAIIESFEGSL